MHTTQQGIYYTHGYTKYCLFYYACKEKACEDTEIFHGKVLHTYTRFRLEIFCLCINSFGFFLLLKFSKYNNTYIRAFF